MCSGQLLSIASNEALFSLLGTIYGGDGRTTFALPDLRGRSMVHFGNGPGLSPITIGEKGGNESTTLTVNNMPTHNHTATLHGETAVADSGNPNNRMLALTQATGNIYASPVAAEDRIMASESIVVGNNGGGQSFSNRSPYLGVNVCIATVGIYPSRN